MINLNKVGKRMMTMAGIGALSFMSYKFLMPDDMKNNIKNMAKNMTSNMNNSGNN